MKKVIIIFLSVFVFLVGFQKSLIFLDYQLNRDFYESQCVNKNKPEVSCHGKCQSAKESEKQNSDLNEARLGFEIYLINDCDFVFNASQCFSVKLTAIFSSYSLEPTTGFAASFPHPPQV
ncbi:MAG TPA: hypothetical protein DD740_03810 [Chryseobacterium sp.]|nr:hypothetical protein [Chryseobacterium sp.]